MCITNIKINSLEELIELVRKTDELFDESLYTTIYCNKDLILSNHTLKTNDEVEQIVNTYFNDSYLNYPVKITCKYISRQKVGHLFSRRENKTKWMVNFENKN